MHVDALHILLSKKTRNNNNSKHFPSIHSVSLSLFVNDKIFSHFLRLGRKLGTIRRPSRKSRKNGNKMWKSHIKCTQTSVIITKQLIFHNKNAYKIYILEMEARLHLQS